MTRRVVESDISQQSAGANTNGPQIIADRANSALVIVATESEYATIEGAIRKLDVMPMQVLIEATIAEVTLNDALQYGTQFFLSNSQGQVTLSNAVSPSPTVIDPTIGNAQLFPGILAPNFPGLAVARVLGEQQFAVQALKDITDVQIISAPKLLIVDKQQARLQVGDLVPTITQTATSVITPGAPVVNAIQYQATGVILTVTPRINSGGLVTLDIEQEVSDVVPTTTSSINSPTFQQRKLQTTVVVQDGETISLAGLISEKRFRENSGIPLLQEIPILGALFSTRTNSNARTELLILLTPRVVNDQRDARALTEELRRKLSTVGPGAVIGRRYAAGRSDGFALIVVLWYLVLIAAISTYLLANARSETALARNMRAAATAEALADAAVAEAVFNQSASPVSVRWKLNGEPHLIVLPHGEATLRLYDETQKINPNHASALLMAALFEAVGVERTLARRLGASIEDWVDSDTEPRTLGAERTQYIDAGRSYSPPNAPIESIDELQLVFGMTPELLARVLPYLTIHTESGEPGGDEAPLIVRRAWLWQHAQPPWTPATTKIPPAYWFQQQRLQQRTLPRHRLDRSCRKCERRRNSQVGNHRALFRWRCVRTQRCREARFRQSQRLRRARLAPRESQRLTVFSDVGFVRQRLMMSASSPVPPVFPSAPKDMTSKGCPWRWLGAR